ncbi:Uncharacterized protein FWK35_00026132 [Aphis craccivora]|uniref:Uncharacterized protein n=1 Tax=Aphis craccivora TaxID=307492 RepID=A0A6G0XQJ9_APHCR|nr:Uncharacterized protein FWK35_00026132 [Aphis craccivora]
MFMIENHHTLPLLLAIEVCTNEVHLLIDYNVYYATGHLYKEKSYLLEFVKLIAYEFNLESSIKVLYCSLVRSILEYGSVVWDPHTTSSSLQLRHVVKGGPGSLRNIDNNTSTNRLKTRNSKYGYRTHI